MKNKIILSNNLIEKEDFVAIKFEIAGSGSYYVVKNRWGNSGNIISELPNLNELKSVRIINLQDLGERDRESFINSLMENIA